MRQPKPTQVTLHSSLRGIAVAILGIICMLAFALSIIVANGLTTVTLVIGLVVLVAVFVVLFDMPIATTFDVDGFTRSTPLRRHRLGWDGVDRLERMRRSRDRPSKGLVAARGIRRVILVDRTEGLSGHRELRAAVGPAVVEAHFGSVDEPLANQIPTWMGRSGRWAPDEGRS